MKLLILGSTGHVGRLIVAQALAQGHDVTAFLRDPAKLAQRHPNLTIFTGDARDDHMIAAAMKGQDAIVSALGHNSARTTDVLTAATHAVLANITDRQRFISLTGDGVGDPHDPKPALGGRLVNRVIRLIPGEMFADAERHARSIRASTAKWVIVRSPRMKGNVPTHNYRTGYFPITLATSVSRGDVADFMLTNLTSNEWLNQAPIVAAK